MSSWREYNPKLSGFKYSELYAAWLGKWFPPYQRSTLHLRRPSSCATWLLKIKALFGNHVPSDAPHIPYDHNPRLTAVKTAKLTWRTWFGKVLLAIVYEDRMYYTYEKCSKVLCHIYIIICAVLTSSQLWIFSHIRKSGFRESFIHCISTLHHGWSVRWKNIV
jgi:hypothetical protein